MKTPFAIEQIERMNVTEDMHQETRESFAEPRHPLVSN
jgi:hypothetical protein